MQPLPAWDLALLVRLCPKIWGAFAMTWLELGQPACTFVGLSRVMHIRAVASHPGEQSSESECLGNKLLMIMILVDMSWLQGLLYGDIARDIP